MGVSKNVRTTHCTVNGSTFWKLALYVQQRKKAPVLVVPCSFSENCHPKTWKITIFCKNSTFPQTNMAPQNGWLEAKRLSFWDGVEPRKEPKEPTGRTNRGGGGYDGNPGTSEAVEQWWGCFGTEKKRQIIYSSKILVCIFLFYIFFFWLFFVWF